MVRILSFLLAVSTFLQIQAQELNGIWRGSFYNKYEYLIYREAAIYRYEVQLYNIGKGVKGVTYSYQDTRFYGKASMIGVWSGPSSNLTIKENSMEDLKIAGGGDGCLMTCYLTYRKEGNREFLEGTYTSVNMKNDTIPCGSGVVRLEKVTTSDFEEEDFIKNPPTAKTGGKPQVKPGQGEFLIKKPAPKTTTPPKTGTTATVKKPATPPAKSPVKKPVTPAPSTAKKTTTTPPKTTTTKPATPQPKPGTVVSKPAPTPTPVPTPKPQPAATNTEPKKIAVKPPAPAVLKNRTNELVETISTSAKVLEISFYDNGEIDGDTISVYNNNRLLVSRKGLSTEPITVRVQLNEEDPDQEVIMVAENLGSIPPNTALMIVQAGSQRFTVRLSSTEQKNALVRFRYDPNALK
ncbi:hypothetical protein [Phnomibacter sp. MR]|uniref:hypothetical protein n=1 Tax=Phnomibacter sp. MR TaxID=3042318 RepID=UPI003A80E583